MSFRPETTLITTRKQLITMLNLTRRVWSVRAGQRQTLDLTHSTEIEARQRAKNTN